MITQVKLTTLTPVHIGSGQKYPMNIEALYDGERIGILSPEKVVGKIGVENIPRWTAVINNHENVWDFLQRFGVKKIDEVCKRTMVAFGKDIGRKKDLKEQLLSSRGNPLLPGSSIKGAIRTAILSNLVFADNSSAKKEIAYYGKKYHNIRDRYKRTGSAISNMYFKGTSKPDANKDVLRFLQVTDAEFEYETIATNVRILNFKHEGWVMKDFGDQLTEAIGVDSETMFRMKIDDVLLQKNKKHKTIYANTGFLSSFEVLFQIINRHTKSLLEKEIKFWTDEFENSNFNRIAQNLANNYIESLKNILEEITQTDTGRSCILRVGGDIGWDFITGAWIKNEQNLLNDDEWEKLYKSLNKGRQIDIFPKTRKLDEDGDFFGFIRLDRI